MSSAHQPSQKRAARPRVSVATSTLFVSLFLLALLLTFAHFGPRSVRPDGTTSRGRGSAATTGAGGAAAPAPPFTTRGNLHPLLYNQHLSHHALHSTPFGLYLASLSSSSRTVAIAGVEYGADVVNFAVAGYRVHAIEPGEQYVAHLRATVAARGAAWDVVVHPYAAGVSSNGTLRVEYHRQTVAREVGVRRLDGLIHGERLALLSADVQGGELDILRGAAGLMPHAIDLVLVEIGRCHPSTLPLLRLLDRHYALFDFVPWGLDLNESSLTPKTLPSYKWGLNRPSGLKEYDAWFCDGRKRFSWLQNDVLAVRRDLVPGVWSRLAGIGEKMCAEKGVNCNLRRLVGGKKKNRL